jgi:hypothetical protein
VSTFLDSAGLGVLVGGLVSNAVVHANGPSLSLTVDEPITNVNLPGFSAGSVVPTANAGGPLGA